MDRLWVRLSMAISSVIAVIFFALLVGFILTLNLAPEGLGQLVAETDPFREGWWGIPEAILRATLYATALGIACGMIVSRFMSHPITKLLNATRLIGDGNLDTRIQLNGVREINELASTFNQMAQDLKDAQERRKNMMADVAHELRTPLTVLEGNLRAALDDVYELEKTDIANLYGQTRHLIHLVNDLRELSLAEANQLPLLFEPVDIEQLVLEIVEMFEPVAEEKGVSLQAKVDGNLQPVEADEKRVRQVLQNLVANGIRHSHAADVVTISATLAKRLELVVADTGDGIEADQFDVIFDRFARAGLQRDTANTSSGLGLASSRAIVHAHGGTLTVTSDGIGKGSSFLISLPIYQKDERIAS
ncbi:MAG: ATP-binding protein [Chloroflexota bacterium]